MNKKIKKFLIIFLFIVVTIGCVLLGIRTRYDARIKINVLKDLKSNVNTGYMIKTKENNIVLIDGGTKENVEKIKNNIIENGEIVEYWFITNLEEDKFGVLNEILKDGSIKVNNIVVSLKSDDWYVINAGELYSDISDFLYTLRDDNIMPLVHNAALRQSFVIDNLKIKILKIADKEDNILDSQTMVLKIDNLFKDIMFFCDLPNNLEEEFVNNNLDEIDVTAIQTYKDKLEDKTLNKILPEIYIDDEKDYIEVW